MGTNARTTPTSTSLISHATHVAFCGFSIDVTGGPDAGRRVESTGSELGIGSAEGNQLQLTDPAVSRHHCSLRVTARGLLIEDHSSTNGTFVDGVDAERAYLVSGSKIAIGETALTVHISTDEQQEPLSPGDHYGDLLGVSAAMRRIFAVLERITPTDVTVLLEGETGTGKTLIAETIHDRGPRGEAPFVVVDCGAIPGNLIESELFGHLKGAFTGAHADRAGAFRSAHGGTVFLDEIGELPLDLQPKLLRILEKHEVKPVGATDPIELDVRIIAATNRDLRSEVNRGNFRADLYYRLNTVRVQIPPLRERRDDIPLLVARIYERYAPGRRPPAELIQSLARQSWPGNVRELRSAVERAVLFGGLADPELAVNETAEDAGVPLVDQFDPERSYRAAKEQAVARFECWFVEELIKRHDGNLSQAARAANMDRNHLRDLLRKHGVAY
jgi:DNA-binding NtrC family response regulator